MPKQDTRKLEDIKDISRFLKYDPKHKNFVFIGSKSLEVIVSSRFEVYGLFDVSDTVTTIGIAELIIDDKYRAKLFMLGKIEIAYSEIDTQDIDGVKYYLLTLNPGDRFICNTEIVKDSSIVYALWVEYISRGNLHYILEYKDIAFLLDQAKELCDANLKLDHVVLEVIYSHLVRTRNNLTVQLRHTDMNANIPWTFIPIREVAYAPDNTTSRVLGSYFERSLNSAILDDNTEKHSLLEDLLR